MAGSVDTQWPPSTGERLSGATLTRSNSDAENEGQDVDYANTDHSPTREIAVVESPGKRARARNFMKRTKEKTKEKTKDLLNLDSSSESDPDSTQDEAMGDTSSDPAFNPSKVLDQNPPTLTESVEKTAKANLVAFGTAVAHPRRTMRDKATHTAANKISLPQRPFLSAEEDRKLLDAHDRLAEITSNTSSRRASDSEASSGDEGEARRKVKNLEAHRASLKVAWTIGRHVDRVRIVQHRVPEPPRRVDFEEKDGTGQVVGFQWKRWMAFVALYQTRGFTSQYVDNFDQPPFDIEDLSRIVERLAMISAPWQTWLMSIREIYLWSNPKRSFLWLVVFETLWYTEHIIGFVFAYVIYATILNRFHPTSVESMRKATERGLDRGGKALAWGELIEKYGREDWIEPLLDELGPNIQMLLGDLVNYLEVLTNFYRWEAPSKTAGTLFLFFVSFLLTVLTDWSYCMRIVWFLGGNLFFFCWPIATHYPKYRLLVDPLKWIFWDVPTNAEWSIKQLQEKALLRQNKNDQEKEESVKQNGRLLHKSALPAQGQREDGEEEFEFAVYKEKSSGQFRINRSGIEYREKSREWKVPYFRLVEMRKDEARKPSKVWDTRRVWEGLEFVYLDEAGGEQQEAFTIEQGMRNEIFSLVLGWSGLRWRSLQMERRTKGAEGSSHLDALRKCLK